jgi:putative Mg2+ transporter-C (MgtC) family protein
LGGLIGFEREVADRPAGLRTHMLVASAAALFVGLTDSFLEIYTGLGYSEFISIDPIRVTQAIVTGVAFLGAGTIFRGGRDKYIQGLTTAASILLVSGIGMAVALNEFILAGGVTLLALMIYFAACGLLRNGEERHGHL